MDPCEYLTSAFRIKLKIRSVLMLLVCGEAEEQEIANDSPKTEHRVLMQWILRLHISLTHQHALSYCAGLDHREGFE